MDAPAVDFVDLLAARERIKDHVARTPLVPSRLLSERAGCQLWLKLENRQHTGSFKPRGALNKILSLSPAERARGVVAASAGNHALGVAYACSRLRIEGAELFVQRDAAPAKLAKLRAFEATVHLVGRSFEEAQQAACARARETGAAFVSAYDDPAVLAGQGTVGLEIVEDLPDLDAVAVPVGGGALSAGVALAVKRARPQARVVGVNAEASPSALRSFEAGHAIDPFDHEPTLAHGLAGGYGRVPYAVARGLIDEIALASEREMGRAIEALIDAEQVLAEPSGAAALAAVLAGRIAGLRAKRVVVVISGGNLDAATLRQVLD